MPPSPILPKALPPNGTIGLIAPSARIHEAFPETTQRAITFLTSLGYRVKIFWTSSPSSSNDDLDTDTDISSSSITNSITTRIDELVAAFTDISLDAIICTIGGTTLNELIPFLLTRDEDSPVRAALRHLRTHNPIPIIGYSDITILHWLLYTQTGLRTFYGPTILGELGDVPKPDAYNVEYLFKAVTANNADEDGPRDRPRPVGRIEPSQQYRSSYPGYVFHPESDKPASLQPGTYTPTAQNPRRFLRGGAATGRLFGGCMSVVVRLGGVRRLVPDWDGRILFLETASAEADDARGVPLARIRAQLADLVAQGVFNFVAGVVFGRFYGYDSPRDIKRVEQVVRELVVNNKGIKNEKYKEFPVVVGGEIGHGGTMVTLPFDALSRLEGEQGEQGVWEIIEAGVY